MFLVQSGSKSKFKQTYFSFFFFFFLYVGENIIIYTVIQMLLYVNLCRNILRLNVFYFSL